MPRFLSSTGTICLFGLLLLGGCGSPSEDAQRSDASPQPDAQQTATTVTSRADTATSWVYPPDDQMNIRLATIYGRADLVQQHLEEGVSPDEAYEENGETPLMLAALMGHRCLTSDLLDAGADPNATSDDGSTALMAASSRGHLAVVKRLLEVGADPNATTDDNSTALFTATVGESAPAVVDVLLNAGADPSVETANGWTPLRSAEHEGHARVAARLREAGATQ